MHPLNISYNMDPLIGQGLINLGGSFVAGGFGAAQQAQANKQNQKNFDRQLEFNKSEAIAGREAQRISTQAREMQLAGLNPLGVSASLGSSPVTATSSTLPNIIPSDNVASQFGLAARNFDVAQIQNLDANTRKTTQETEGVKYTNEILESDAKFRDAINTQHLDLESSNTKLNLNLAQRANDMTPLECEQLRASTKVALQQVDNMQKGLEQMDAVIDNLASQNKLNDKKCEEIAQGIKESMARTYKTYKEAHKLDKDMEYLDNLIDQVKVSVARDNIQLTLDGLDLKLMLKDGGYDLRKASIAYDMKLLPIRKTTEAFAPILQCAGSAMGDAAKIAGVVLR